MKYTFYEDPGHGWLKVPTLELRELGIAHKISTCSFIHPSGKSVYLEEDCDLTTFMEAKMPDMTWPERREWFAKNVEVNDRATLWPGRDARCRNFPNYKPPVELIGLDHIARQMVFELAAKEAT